MRRRLIASRLRAKTDGETVPAVNRNNRERKVRQFLFAELFPCLFIEIVGNMIVGNQGQSFRPCQSRSFTLGVIRCLPPGAESVETLLFLRLPAHPCYAY